MRMKNHFHIKGWAIHLVLIQSPRGTRKWPIQSQQDFDNIFGPQLSRAKEDLTQNFVIVHEKNKDNIEWNLVLLQIFGKEVIS